MENKKEARLSINVVSVDVNEELDIMLNNEELDIMLNAAMNGCGVDPDPPKPR